MAPKHIPILKANKGERIALAHLDGRSADRLLPLLEVTRLTDDITRRPKYVSTSSTPVMAHLNRAIDLTAAVWIGRTSMVDGYFWPANARAENGDHVIPYMVSRLRSAGVSVVPVVGYDRWSNSDYRLALGTIPRRPDGNFCLRLDTSAVEDSAEPGLVEETVTDIVEQLELDPNQCSVLIDFADISMNAKSVERLVEDASALIYQLQGFAFKYFAIAGCSIPRSIDLAVEKHDCSGSVLRKEMLIWQALRLNFPGITIVSSDYGVRGPTTSEAPSPNTNGKIRYSIKKQVFIARGHPLSKDHNNGQMHGLSLAITRSEHFLGARFSWGDSEVQRCCQQGAFGGTTEWIAIDTNHHLTFVIHEVEAFEHEIAERSIVRED